MGGAWARRRITFALLASLVLMAFVGPAAALASTAVSGTVSFPADSTPPIADAGPDQTADEDTFVTFDGSASADDVGIVNYTWVMTGQVGPVERLAPLSVGGSDIALDPARPLIYFLQTDRVAVVNLSTGGVERTWSIEHTPLYAMSMSISPHGTYLVVGIPTGERGYYNFGPYESYLATFDLKSQSKIGEFFVDEDIYRTLVTSDGWAIVAGGSGQDAGLRMFDVRTGAEAPNCCTYIWQYSAIALHPSETRVYSVDEGGLSPLGVHRFDFVPQQGFTETSYWPHHGTYPGQPMWASPNLLLTGGGYLLRSQENASGDMQIITQLPTVPILHAAFHPSLPLIAVSNWSALEFYDAETHVRRGAVNLGSTIVAMTFRGDSIYAIVDNWIVAVRAPLAVLYGAQPSSYFPHPGRFMANLTVWDAAGNSASDTMDLAVRDLTSPVAEAGPDMAALTGATVRFDGSLSWDNGGIVDYEWAFVDLELVTLRGVFAEYTFLREGTYVVTLTTTDAALNRANDSMTVVIQLDVTPPVANAGPDRNVPDGTKITFDASMSYDDVRIVDFLWTFTDGGTIDLHGSLANYTFLRAGEYTVTLIASDAQGNQGMDTTQIIVWEIPFTRIVHPRTAFSVGLPIGWTVKLDVAFRDIGTVDLIATGTFSGGGLAGLLVYSEVAEVSESDTFLLATASDAIASLRLDDPYLVIEREPEIVETANARAVVFELHLGADNVNEVWAIVVNEAHGRMWLIVADADSQDADTYRPVFEKAIRSFEVAAPPSVIQRSALLVGLMFALGGAGIGGLISWLATRPRSTHVRGPKALVASEATRAAAFGVGCPACSQLVPRAMFCVCCGARLRT